MSGTAIRREDNTLAWKPGRRLKPSEYALAREAGFKWHKGMKAWVAKRTPEREAFLLKFVSELPQERPNPFAQRFSVRRNGQPLPELVDARLTANKKRLVLYISDTGRQFYQRIDMTRSGAGLARYSELSGSMAFSRDIKETAGGDDAPFRHYLRNICGIYSVRRDLAEALVFLLWSREVVLSDWPESEGVQPVQPLSNAAD